MGIIPLRYKEIDETTPIVVMCHGGVRLAKYVNTQSHLDLMLQL
jgi:hypothetical protein